MADVLFDDLGLLLALLTVVGGVIGFLYRFERERYETKLSTLQERFDLDLASTKAEREADVERLHREYAAQLAALREKGVEEKQLKDREISEIKQSFEAQYEALKEEANSAKASATIDDAIPLVQEEKMVYIKYLYIRPTTGAPAYTKYIDRIKRHLDIYSEYYFVRFNKFSKARNSITIRDRTSGVVDLTLIYPWKRLSFADEGSATIPQVITQDLAGQDTYFTASTYYNGFSEGNEDVAIKMEMDTTVARMVADFSSVVGFESLFTREPEAYRIDTDQQKTKLLGLEEHKPGVYHIEVHNLQKGEVVMLDFHVDWEHLEATAAA
jgi:hypothetical protein